MLFMISFHSFQNHVKLFFLEIMKILCVHILFEPEDVLELVTFQSDHMSREAAGSMMISLINHSSRSEFTADLEL